MFQQFTLDPGFPQKVGELTSALPKEGCVKEINMGCDLGDQ